MSNNPTRLTMDMIQIPTLKHCVMKIERYTEAVCASQS